MIYIRMCDSLIREAPMPLVHVLCTWLVRLGSDEVKNVRHCWAYTLLPHIRKAGRLAENLPIVGLAADMANTDDDPEIRRVLQEIHFDELAVLQASSVDSVVDAESDFDETMNANKLANKDDAGICSEYGVSEPTITLYIDDMETDGLGSATSPTALATAGSPTSLAISLGSAASPTALASAGSPTALVSAGSPTAHLSEGSPTSPGRVASPTAAQPAEGLGLPNGQARQDLTKPGLILDLDSPSKKESQSPSNWSLGSPGTPGTPTVTPPSSPVRDFIEDKLVEQSEVERVMNATFADHRLLIEVEEDSEDTDAGPSDLENVDESASDLLINSFSA